MAQQEETAITQVIHFNSTANNIQIGTGQEFIHVGKSSVLPDGVTELKESFQEMQDQIETNHVSVMDQIGEIYDNIKYHDMDITRIKDLYRELLEDMKSVNELVVNQKTSFQDTMIDLQTKCNYLESDLKQKWEATESSLHAQRRGVRSLQNQFTKSLAAVEQPGILINSPQAQCMDFVHSNKINDRLIAELNTDIQVNHHELLKVTLRDTKDHGRINQIQFPEIDVCPAFCISKKVSNPGFIKEQTRDWLTKRNEWYDTWHGWMVTMNGWWTREDQVPRDRLELVEQVNEWIKAIESGVSKMIRGHGNFVKFYEKIGCLPKKSRNQLGWSSINKINQRIKDIKVDQKIMLTAFNDDITEIERCLYRLTLGLVGKISTLNKHHLVRDHHLFILMKQELNLYPAIEHINRMFRMFD